LFNKEQIVQECPAKAGFNNDATEAQLKYKSWYQKKYLCKQIFSL
jgi:hypothetical protein